MASAIAILNTILPMAYLVSLYLYSDYFLNGRSRKSDVMGFALGGTVVLHILAIALRGSHYNHFPITTVAEAASMISLFIAVIYFYIEQRIRVRTTGMFVLSAAFLLQLFSSLMISGQHQTPAVLENPLFIFHTSAAMLGYAALFISALFAIMYLLLFHQIKEARFGMIYQRLPSLDQLNLMNVRAAGIGFVFLALAIFLGIVWRKEAFPDEAHFDPKVIAAYVSWVIYGLIILGHRFLKWPGKWLAYLSFGGFIIILLSLTVINLFVTSFHRFS